MFLALLLFIGSTFADDPDCFASGQCTNSILVNEWETSDPQECLDFCRGDDNCLYFTSDVSDGFCLGLNNCEDFVECDSGEECYSGGSDCPDLQCSVDGICTFSLIVESTTASSESDCLDQCKNNADCNWYSFDSSDNACLLFGNCEEIDDTVCTTCSSGQRPCSGTDDGGNTGGEVTKILVVGGLGGPVSSVELIDLNSNTECSFRADYPSPITSSTGALYQGNRPIVCGGDTEDDESSAISGCTEYLDTDEWVVVPNMVVQRQWHKSSLRSDGRWLITGGYGSDQGGTNFVYLDSTEYFEEGLSDITLPLALAGHCQLTDPDGQVFILGGEVDVGVSTSEFYKLDDSDQYIIMPDIPEAIFEATCGLIQNSVNGQEIVVLGNGGTTHIFNFASNSWRIGPNSYPASDYFYGATVQTGNTFIKVGGETGFSPSNTLYRFDEENYSWVLLPQTLSVNRYGAVAIPLPNDFATC